MAEDTVPQHTPSSTAVLIILDSQVHWQAVPWSVVSQLWHQSCYGFITGCLTMYLQSRG